MRLLTLAALLAGTVLTTHTALANNYQVKNLVANKAAYHPVIIDPLMINGWGLALRTAGEGGHFWISNTDTGTTTTYVGDVNGRPIFQDQLKVVQIPKPSNAKADEPSHPTGQVYNASKTEFMISGQGVTGPAKFIFVTEDGTLSAWADPVGDAHMTQAALMADHSACGANYKGVAISTLSDNNRLYAADFANRKIDVWDNEFKPVQLPPDAFQLPAAIPANYAPFNIQWLNGKLLVAYAMTGREPGEEEKGKGRGYIAAFDYSGKLLNVWQGGGKLNAPWGFAQAPDDFGAHGGEILVGNFGDGTIVGFDPATGMQTDYLRGAGGKPIQVDGIWGMAFGNGASLGQANHLYFAAGPKDEQDGVFGKVFWVE